MSALQSIFDIKLRFAEGKGPAQECKLLFTGLRPSSRLGYASCIQTVGSAFTVGNINDTTPIRQVEVHHEGDATFTCRNVIGVRFIPSRRIHR